MAISKASAALVKMQAELKSTLNLALRRDAAVAIGRVAHRLALEGIAAAKNPQGRPWKALASGRGLPLRYLVGTLKLQMGVMQFSLVEGKAYARVHQKGARKRGSAWKLPARSFVPRGKSLPRPWAEEMILAFKNYSKRLSLFAQKHTSGMVRV